MPLALLLQETFGRLINGTKLIEPWSQLSELETVLIGRARSAFLAHWFGPRLPIDGVALRIAVANLPDLQLRYRQMAEEARRRQAPEGGPSLFEPLAGLGGILVGVLASPTGILVAGFAVMLRGGGWLRVLLVALGMIVGAALVPLVGGAIGLLGVPLGLLTALILSASNPEELRLVFGLLQAVTALLEAALGFVNQLLGPRSGVRNPLIRAVLEIFDRVAVFFTHLLALVAILIARLGPLLEPLALQARLLLDLTAVVIDAIGFLFTDFMNRLVALYQDPPVFMELDTYLDALERSTGEPVTSLIGVARGMLSFFGRFFERPKSPLTVVMGVVGTLRSITTVIRRGVEALIRQIVQDLLPAIRITAVGVLNWVASVRQMLTDALLAHPVFATLLSIGGALRAAKTAIDTAVPVGGTTPTPPPAAPPPAPTTPATPSAPAAPPSPPGILERLGRAILAVPDIPDFGRVSGAIRRRIGDRFDSDAIRRRAVALDINTLAPELALTDEGRRRMDELLREPIDPLRAERLRLEQRAGGDPAERLRAMRAEELPLRQALFAVLQRVFPETVGRYLRQLQSLMETFDRQIYGLSDAELQTERQAAASQELPTLAVAESDRLRPVVRRLHLQVPQQDESVVMAWSERLQEMLRGQEYRVNPR